jgi:hypothetical protein
VQAVSGASSRTGTNPRPAVFEVFESAGAPQTFSTDVDERVPALNPDLSFVDPLRIATFAEDEHDPAVRAAYRGRAAAEARAVRERVRDQRHRFVHVHLPKAGLRLAKEPPPGDVRTAAVAIDHRLEPPASGNPREADQVRLEPLISGDRIWDDQNTTPKTRTLSNK